MNNPSSSQELREFLFEFRNLRLKVIANYLFIRSVLHKAARSGLLFFLSRSDNLLGAFPAWQRAMVRWPSCLLAVGGAAMLYAATPGTAVPEAATLGEVVLCAATLGAAIVDGAVLDATGWIVGVNTDRRGTIFGNQPDHCACCHQPVRPIP